jgi:hypothetical protein
MDAPDFKIHLPLLPAGLCFGFWMELWLFRVPELGTAFRLLTWGMAMGAVLFAAAYLLLRNRRDRQSPLTINLMLAATSIIGTFVFFENIITSVFFLRGFGTTCVIRTSNGPASRFDPIRGSFLNPVEHRLAMIYGGRLEYVTTSRGNNAGFHDRDDYTLTRTRADTQRYAVFGDSFTAEFFLKQTWPDRVEDLTKSAGHPAELLSFAMYGAGLPNWCNVLHELVLGRYTIDGVVFAVYEDDLDRHFLMSDDTIGRGFRGRWPSLDRKTFPKTWDEARPKMRQPAKSDVVTAEEFERTVNMPIPWSSTFSIPVPVITETSWNVLRGRTSNIENDHFAGFSAGQQALISELKEALNRHSLPRTVVFLPSRRRLLEKSRPRVRPAVQQFARVLEAQFFDGGEVFSGLTGREIRAQFHPHDMHWNQQGSDLFAKWFVDRVLPALPGAASNGQ